MKYTRTLILLICLVLTGTAAFAQVKEVTEDEKVVFAFYTLSKGTPDFDHWIKSTQRYINQPDQYARADYLRIEELRLQYGFGTYQKNDPIRIHTAAKFMLQGSENNATLLFAFANGSHDGSTPYFPFQYGDQWIAFLVSDLLKFREIKLTPEQFREMSQTLPVGKPVDGVATMQLRPLKADASAPITVDGVDQWAMMGDTGYLNLQVALASGAQKTIWSYTAPWFLSPTEKELYPLLQH